MKRRLVCLLIALVICVGMVGNTFALADETAQASAIEPRGAITLSTGLDNLGGGQYRARASISTGSIESLQVSFMLYQVVNGSEQYKTGASNSDTAAKITASSTVSLTSGTYHMYYSGSGNTVSSGSKDRYFYI